MDMKQQHVRFKELCLQESTIVFFFFNDCFIMIVLETFKYLQSCVIVMGAALKSHLRLGLFWTEMTENK